MSVYAELLQGLEFDRIAGIPYGSLPTATGLSLQLHKPLIYPRKEVKAHGARRLIEGDFNEGDVVALVDDILITGSDALRRLAERGYRVRAVLDIARITAVLRRHGRLSEAQASLLSHQVPAVSPV